MHDDNPFQDELGRRVTLTIRRFGPPGAFLATAPREERGEPTLLLPAAEVPGGARPGDRVTVFVYLDSEGRPVGTTRAPKVELGEVAFLEVKACEEFGSFVDWGLPKDLFVPFREQVARLRVGARYPFGLYVDPQGRLAGTMRVNKLLERARPRFAREDWVDGEAWRDEPGIGLFVIVERRALGVVPASEPHRLSRGQAARFRVANLLPDGKIELSLRGRAHEELDSDAQRILALLHGKSPPRFGDGSSPDEIRALFGLSKKAFKRALGRLLKQGTVALDAHGYVVLR